MITDYTAAVQTLVSKKSGIAYKLQTHIMDFYKKHHLFQLRQMEDTLPLIQLKRVIIDNTLLNRTNNLVR